MLEEDELKDSILLVFANKQDSRGALNAQQVQSNGSTLALIFSPLILVCVGF